MEIPVWTEPLKFKRKVYSEASKEELGLRKVIAKAFKSGKNLYFYGSWVVTFWKRKTWKLVPNQEIWFIEDNDEYLRTFEFQGYKGNIGTLIETKREKIN